MKEKDQLILMLFGGTLIFILLVVLLVMFLLAYKRRQLKHILEKIAFKHEFDKQLLQSRLETQERSFQYFSEEIHDNVGQVLSVVGMHLYQLQAEYAGDRASKLLVKSSDLLNKAINDLRMISHTINARYINKGGLREALGKEIEYLNVGKQVVLRLQVSGEPAELTGDRQTLLFRIIQEAMSNAMIHARASLITVELNYDAGRLTAAVRDNGSGFDSGKVTDLSKAGLGLMNMKLRTRLLGGQLFVQSTPGQGTSISLTVDVKPKNT